MLSSENCSIVFDNRPNAIFYSGETVTGTLTLELTKEKSCQALILNMFGKSKCKWSEFSGVRHQFTSTEIYFDIYNNLMAGQEMRTTLLSGRHVFKFSFVIPRNSPSSLEGKFGYVRYGITLTMKRLVKLDTYYAAYFTVLSQIDLNSIYSMQLPVVKETSKTFHWLLSKQGQLHMTVQIPFSGYIAGQTIKIKCTINNESTVNVNSVKFKLIRKILYTATTPYINYRKENLLISSCEVDGVDGKNEATFDASIDVPSIPPSTLESSLIIKARYDLVVIANVPGLHLNLRSKTPITIGTIPILNQLSSENPISTTSLESSALIPDYSDIPPPTYEESMSEEKMVANKESRI